MSKVTSKPETYECPCGYFFEIVSGRTYYGKYGVGLVLLANGRVALHDWGGGVRKRLRDFVKRHMEVVHGRTNLDSV